MKKKIVGLLVAALILAVLVVTVERAGSAKGDSIQHVRVKINSKNSKWQKVPGITLKEGDVLILRADGKVKVYTDIAGEYFAGPSGGAGKLTKSELQLKIGANYKTTFPGKNFVMLGSNQTGDLELRFRDIDYYDNKGEFTVTVLYIPVSQVPKVKDVQIVSDQKEPPPAPPPDQPPVQPSTPTPSQTGESPW